MAREKTFSEIVAEVRAQPPTQPDVYPGGHNGAGEFFDPACLELSRRAAAVSPKEAQVLVLEGALLAWEGCGCGGFSGCQPRWVEADVRIKMANSSMPRFTKHPGVSSSWIDVWENDQTVVVYAHGSVVWEDALG